MKVDFILTDFVWPAHCYLCWILWCCSWFIIAVNMWFFFTFTRSPVLIWVKQYSLPVVLVYLPWMYHWFERNLIISCVKWYHLLLLWKQALHPALPLTIPVKVFTVCVPVTFQLNKIPTMIPRASGSLTFIQELFQQVFQLFSQFHVTLCK